MPITQNERALLLDSANDHSNALDTLISLIKREVTLVNTQAQSPQSALDLIDLWADRNQLLKNNARSLSTIQIENDKFTRTYHRNITLAKRKRMERGRQPHRVYRQFIPELDISTLSSIPSISFLTSKNPMTISAFEATQLAPHTQNAEDESFTTPAENQPEDVSSYLDDYFSKHPEDKLDK